MKFPFINVIVSGKHTEIVLTRGVGLHTILGMTIDVAIGDCFDKAYTMFLKFEKILKNKKSQEDFIKKYNSNTKGEQIP